MPIRRAMSECSTTWSDDEREVPIDPRVAEILRVAVAGKRLTDRVVLTTEGTTPVRRCFCSSLLRRCAGIELVRLVPGHAGIETTARCRHATEEQA